MEKLKTTTACKITETMEKEFKKATKALNTNKSELLRNLIGEFLKNNYKFN